MQIQISAIQIGERQRKSIDSEKLTELAKSIELVGLIHPIVVNRQLQLVAGERRLRAHQLLKRETIEARIFEDLTPEQQQLVELEENIRRVDLPWPDYVSTVQRLHKLYAAGSDSWSISQTAERIGMSEQNVGRLLIVADEVASRPEAKKEAGVSAVYNSIRRRTAREIDTQLTEALAAPEVIIGESAPPPTRHQLLCTSFLTWAPTYSGPKFNVLHCDFPYGLNLQDAKMQGSRKSTGRYDDTPELYSRLLATIVNSWSRIFAPSGHGIFWFSQKYYDFTLSEFAKVPNLSVDPFLLIWHKSDLAGVLPDPTRGPRRTYESALFLSWGDRPIVRAVSNSISHPRGRSEIEHISEKPLPVVSHFLSMLVDTSSSLLDPTCGSGTALVAALNLGASRVLGLDIEQQYIDLTLHNISKANSLGSLIGSL